MHPADQAPAIEFVEATDVAQLELRVQARISGRVRRLRLVAAGAGVILRGLARTYHAKQLAQHAVMQITALPIVANEIEVA